jgi:hypothetical protein
MARKITPSGTGGYPDLNIYEDSQDSTWLENLTANIAQNYKDIVKRKETNNMTAVQVLQGLAETATDSSQIAEIRNIYDQNFDSTFVSNNPGYNTVVDAANFLIDSKDDQITDFESSSKEFIGKLYSTNNVFKTNMLNLNQDNLLKLFKDMNIDETKGWIESSKNFRDEINIYKQNLQDLYGNKNGNFKINANGEQRSINELSRDLNRMDELIDALTMKALDDNILSPQEAKELANIRPSQGYGTEQFKRFIKGKRDLANTLREKGNKYLYNDSLKLVGKILSQKNKEGFGAEAMAAMAGLFEDEEGKEVSGAAIPIMEGTQYEDENGLTVTVPPITGIMSEEEKINNFKQRLQAGLVDSSTLEGFLETVVGEGSRLIKQSNLMYDAYGGRPDALGFEEEDPDSSSFWLKQSIKDDDSGDDSKDKDVVISKETKDFWASLSDEEKKYYESEYNIKNEKSLQIYTKGELANAPALPAVLNPDDDKNESKDLTTKKGIKPFSDLSSNEKKELANQRKKIIDTTVGGINKRRSAKYSAMTLKEFYEDITKPKEEEVKVSIDDFMNNISLGSGNLSSKERNYIKSRSKSGFSTNKLFSLVRKYKLSNNASEQEKIKLQIEKLIK